MQYSSVDSSNLDPSAGTCKDWFCKEYQNIMLNALKFQTLLSFNSQVKCCLSGPEVIKPFPCSTQLSMKFVLLINVKMPTIVGILTFISMINTTAERSKQYTSSIDSILVFMSS